MFSYPLILFKQQNILSTFMWHTLCATDMEMQKMYSMLLRSSSGRSISEDNHNTLLLNIAIKT